MKRFSERIGITKPPVIQLGDINQPLRNSLWNIVLEYLDCLYEKDYGQVQFIKDVARLFLKAPVDEVHSWSGGVAQKWLKQRFSKLQWYEVYEFIEFLVQSNAYFKKKVQEINKVLEEENSGYRYINGQFAPVTSEQEIKEIDEAIDKATKVGMEGAREHLSSALSLLAKKPEPDYRNSIKESISAVESVAKQISGERGGGLDKALEELSKKAEVHGALKQGFLKLYGYASDEDGIRHAILEDPNVGFDEAKFMLVSCSAFVNFLFSKAQKAGLLKEM